MRGGNELCFDMPLSMQVDPSVRLVGSNNHPSARLFLDRGRCLDLLALEYPIENAVGGYQL